MILQDVTDVFAQSIQGDLRGRGGFSKLTTKEEGRLVTALSIMWVVAPRVEKRGYRPPLNQPLIGRPVAFQIAMRYCNYGCVDMNAISFYSKASKSPSILFRLQFSIDILGTYDEPNGQYNVGVSCCSNLDRITTHKTLEINWAVDDVDRFFHV